MWYYIHILYLMNSWQKNKCHVNGLSKVVFFFGLFMFTCYDCFSAHGLSSAGVGGLSAGKFLLTCILWTCVYNITWVHFILIHVQNVCIWEDVSKLWKLCPIQLFIIKQ
jgi:hypothetical protein